MLTCAKEVLAVLVDRLDAQIALGQRIVAMSGELTDLTPDDVKQMAVGFQQVLTEAVLGQEKTIFKFFTETVISGVRAQGQSPETIIRISVVFITSVVADLMRSVAPEHRDELIPWLATFTGDYISAAMVTALGGPTSKSP
jgi:hypothetical protein